MRFFEELRINLTFFDYLHDCVYVLVTTTLFHRILLPNTKLFCCELRDSINEKPLRRSHGLRKSLYRLYSTLRYIMDQFGGIAPV